MLFFSKKTMRHTIMPTALSDQFGSQYHPTNPVPERSRRETLLTKNPDSNEPGFLFLNVYVCVI